MHSLHAHLPTLSWMKTIRLVATDMDGTLTCQGKFTPALLQALTDLAASQKDVLIVTGRSAGWVSGLASYLPIAGAIAENGGLFYAANLEIPTFLTDIPDLGTHRAQLQDAFYQLKAEFPQLQESTDNRFRLTDWTFDVQGLSATTLEQLRESASQLGLGFTYSSVQCHLMPLGQDKAKALLQVLRVLFPDYNTAEVVTVGDSPNDRSLFNPEYFPYSVGVANIGEYLDRLPYPPAFITNAAEGQGFCELADLLVRLS